MWPKALSQLVEFAPQIVNLLPLADRFFKERAAGDNTVRQAVDDLKSHHQSALESQKAALSEVSDRIHADLTAISTQQTAQAKDTVALQGRVADLEKHLGSMRADALAAKQAAETSEARLARVEAGQARIQILTIVALVFLLVALALLLVLLARAH